MYYFRAFTSYISKSASLFKVCFGPGLAVGQGSKKVRLGSKINSDVILVKVEISISI